ncbi:MAG: DUF6361 family protein [Chloroflexota bacterium]|nr:DUF6361 family protein [Chloroflexota bacterium]MDE2885693.1 DUF6361 family protein [Chloroflexota bacterium]
MNEVSNSTLSWLDSSEHERRTVLQLVSALNEPGTLDELGIGSIRDTFSDALFPGTSTIQTRARYFLFVPWIMQMVEASSTPNHANHARWLQLQLRNALVESHVGEPGVIGREAGANLQRWPHDIYWLGTASWGIRRYPGSIPAYFESLRHPSFRVRFGRALEEPVEGRRDEASEGVAGNWANVPARPRDFPAIATFTLSLEEGEYLRERVELTHSQSFLAHILRHSRVEQLRAGRLPWDHPVAESASATARAWLRDAQLFSLVHQGGVLLFNLMLAELLGDESSERDYSDRLANWSRDVDALGTELSRWDRDSMWRRLHHANPRLRPRTREFADRWFELVSAPGSGPIQDSQDARRLVRERERALKGVRARLSYAEARDRKRGYPFSGLLEYRWTQVKSIGGDILSALEGS